MQLDELAKPLLEVIGGRRCLWLDNDTLGNVGDRMISAGTRAFLQRYRVSYERWPISGRMPTSGGFDLVLLFGSGSVGACCRNVADYRRAAATWGLPCVLLPSSVMDSGEDLSYCSAVFAREGLSAQLLQINRRAPDVHVMPDLAHWYQPDLQPTGKRNRKRGPEPAATEHYYLRADNAAPDFGRPTADPIRFAGGPLGYVRLAHQHARVITNRLHFAIAALNAGREATLVPTTWHKTRAYYQQWEMQFGARLTWQWEV